MNSDIHFWIHNKPTSSGKTKAVCHECQGDGGPGVGELGSGGSCGQSGRDGGGGCSSAGNGVDENDN